MTFVRATRFVERPTCFAGSRKHRGWRLKVYDIRRRDEPIEEGPYGVALEKLLEQLPEPAITTDRPGVGFIIRHQGHEFQYAVLCWWDSQDELVLRILVRKRQDSSATWGPPTAAQSICVYDLSVIWFERNAYIEHVLAPQDGPNVDAYFAAHAD